MTKHPRLPLAVERTKEEAVLVLLSLLPAVPAMSHAGGTTSPHRPVRATTLAATFLGLSPNPSNTRARKERS